MAEHYFDLEPKDCAAKLRQMAEYMAQLVSARVGLDVTSQDTFLDVIRRLSNSGALPREMAEVFHAVRKVGNTATHEHETVITHGQALHMLKLARLLAVWVRRTITGDEQFSAGPFIPPAPPEDADQPLRDELEELRSALADRDAELAKVRDHAATIAEERAVYAALAEDAESRLVDEKLRFEQTLTAARAEASHQTVDTLRQRVAVAATAGADLDLDEADTRRLIDLQLQAAGWEADTDRLTWRLGARPVKGRSLAIAEWPTARGPADYVLFIGLQAVAVVEAKRRARDVPGAIQQAKRYARSFTFDGGAVPAGGPWGEFAVPFLFATNGRPYLRQLETKSGVWFLDARSPSNHPRGLDGWYSPEGLAKELAKDVAGAETRLAAEQPDYLPLRDYQIDAVRAAERAIAGGKRTALLAMATGTGKTRTAIGLVYRLVKSGRFRRVLFLVDRTALGEQAGNAFKDVPIEQLQSFTEIYDVKELGDLDLDPDTRVHIATVQSLMMRLLYPAEGDEPIPVDTYDCIVVDECHRGYNLDREMTDAELDLRSEADYISKYRRVIEHFDAVKIGLTATPALHTTEIFGEPVFDYSYRRAVVDGWLIDHDPPLRISTRLAREGIHWATGETVPLFDPALGQIELFRTPDELDFEVEHFNRQVITESFNRVVCDELAKHIDPDLPGKTLVFCATDQHADMVVHLLKAAFEDRYGSLDDDAVVKITAAADRPLQLIRRFKNEHDPRVAVTVDLLTTGIDVPEITNLVFIRRVRSRILYEQMLGRATRRCDEIGKESFRIFDAVDLYAILENVSSMRPVVPGPETTFGLLVDLIGKAGGEARAEEFYTQLVAKLQAKKRMLDEHHAGEIHHHTGGTAEQLVRRIRGMEPADAAKWLAERPTLVAFLDAARFPGPKLFVSDHEDEVIAVDRGWGEYERPEDYLDAFAAFVRSNMNQIPALVAVVQRPRDLTREQLRELLLALEEKGFTERGIASAWREARNQDIAARVIGYIRTQALGSPLEPYEARVDRALGRILSRGRWSEPQRRWLQRIAAQLKKEVVVDRAALDQGEFKQHGGFARLDKVFDGRLEQVLHDLAGAVWEESA